MNLRTKSLSAISVLSVLFFNCVTTVHADNPEAEIREALMKQLELKLTPLCGEAVDYHLRLEDNR